MDKSTNYKSKTVAITTTATEAVTLDKNRHALILWNVGASDVQLSLDVEAEYIVLPAGKGIHFPVAAINSINAKTASGTSTLNVWEG